MKTKTKKEVKVVQAIPTKRKKTVLYENEPTTIEVKERHKQFIKDMAKASRAEKKAKKKYADMKKQFLDEIVGEYLSEEELDLIAEYESNKYIDFVADSEVVRDTLQDNEVLDKEEAFKRAIKGKYIQNVSSISIPKIKQYLSEKEIGELIEPAPYTQKVSTYKI